MSSVKISELEQITQCSANDDILIPIALKSGTVYVSKALTIEALQSIIGNSISSTDAYTSLEKQIEDIKNNATGADTFEWEFVYKLTTTNTAPILTESSDAHYIDKYLPEGWIDDAPVVTSSTPYCWAAMRYKISASRWSSFGTPFIWSVFGKNGRDGNSIEYIFKASNEVIPKEERNSLVIMQGLSVNSKSYQVAGVIPEGWSDDPADMTDYRYQYMSYRKYNGTTWSKFYDSVLWSYRALDGDPAESGAIIDFGNDMGAIPFKLDENKYVPCKVDDIIETTTAYVKLNGTNVTPDTIGFSTTNTTNATYLSSGETITINNTTFKVTKQFTDWLIQITDASQTGNTHDVKIWFTIEDENLNPITVNKIFKLVEIMPGTDGTSVNYQIVPTTTQISCDSDGNNPQPSTVTFNAVKYTNGVPSSCLLNKDLYLLIDKDGTDNSVKITDSNKTTVYASDFASYVTASLYCNNELVDCETIKKSKDGAPYTYLKFGTPDLAIFSVNSDGTPIETLDDKTQWELPIYIYKGDVLQAPDKYLDEDSETLVVNIDGEIVEDKSLYKVIVYDNCMVLSMSYTVLKQLVFRNINPNTINLTLTSNTNDGTIVLTGSYTIYKSIKGDSASLLYNIIASNDSVLLDDTSDSTVLKQASLNDISVFYNGVKQSIVLTVDEDALSDYNFKIKVDGTTTYLEYADTSQYVNMNGLEKRTGSYTVNISVKGEIIGQVVVNILIWAKISTDGSVPMLQVIPPTFTSKTSKGKAQITLKRVGAQSSVDLELGISSSDSDYWVCLKNANGDTSYGSSARSTNKKTVTISGITYNDISNGLYCYLYWKDVLLSREHLEYIFNSQETYSGSGEFLIDPSLPSATFNYSPVGTAAYIIYTFKDCADYVNFVTFATKQGDLNIITSETTKDVSIVFPKSTMLKGDLNDINFNGLQYTTAVDWITSDRSMLNSIHWNTCTSVVISYYSETHQLVYETTIVRTGLDGYYFDVDDNGLISIQSTSKGISSLSQTATEISSTISTSLRNNLLTKSTDAWNLNEINNLKVSESTSTKIEQSLGDITSILIEQRTPQSTSWQGIFTTIELEPNKNYTFTCFFHTTLDPTNPNCIVSIGPESKSGLTVDKCEYKEYNESSFWWQQNITAVDYGDSCDIPINTHNWYQAIIQFHVDSKDSYVMRLYGNISEYIENAIFHFANITLYNEAINTSVSAIAQTASSITLDVCDKAGLKIEDGKVKLKGAVQATNFSFLNKEEDKPLVTMCSKQDLLENSDFMPDVGLEDLKDALSGFDSTDILIVQYTYTENGKEVKYYAALTALGGLSNIVVGYVNYLELNSLEQKDGDLYYSNEYANEINGKGDAYVHGNYTDKYKQSSEYYINIPQYKKAYLVYNIKEQTLYLSTTAKNFNKLTTEYIAILSVSRDISRKPDRSSAVTNYVYVADKIYSAQVGLLLEVYKYDGNYSRYGQCILGGLITDLSEIYSEEENFENATGQFLNNIIFNFSGKDYEYSDTYKSGLTNYWYGETYNYVNQKEDVKQYFEVQDEAILKSANIQKYNIITNYDSNKNYSFPNLEYNLNDISTSSIPFRYNKDNEVIIQYVNADSANVIIAGFNNTNPEEGNYKITLNRITTFEPKCSLTFREPEEITITENNSITFMLPCELSYSGIIGNTTRSVYESNSWHDDDTIYDRELSSSVSLTLNTTITTQKVVDIEVHYNIDDEDLDYGWIDGQLETIKNTLKDVIDNIDYTYLKELFTNSTNKESVLQASVEPSIYLNCTSTGVQTIKMNNIVASFFVKEDTTWNANLSTTDVMSIKPMYRNIFGFYNQTPDNLITYNTLVNKLDKYNDIIPIDCVIYTLNNGDLYAKIATIRESKITQKSKTLSFRFKDNNVTSNSFI